MINRFIFSICVIFFVPFNTWTSLYAQGNSTLINLPPRTWYEVPNSKIRAICPSEPPEILQGGCDCVCVIDDWSGGVYDTNHEKLLVWGGGHNDYYGNELYAFDIKTLSWELLTQPSSPASPGNCTEVLSDGNPNARHTYGGLAYITHADRLFAHGGSLACGRGTSSQKTWTFDVNTTQWVDMQPSGVVSTWDLLNEYSVYDPVTKKVYLFWHNQLFSYDYDGNSWQNHDTNELSWDARGIAIDTKRRLLVEVGNKRSETGSGVVRVRDIDSLTPQIWNTSGGSQLINTYAPGLAYDPVADRIIGWNGGSVYALDMETRVWEEINVPGAPSRTSTGIFGRFRYIPQHNVFIAVTSVDENVHFYKNEDITTPVELVSFTIESSEGKTVLRWKTASETNNYGFEIERRSGNLDFEKVGFIRGKGSTTQMQSYFFGDKSVQTSVTYTYRLKQIDLDGTFEYSQELTIEVGVPIKFKLLGNYPNPFNPVTTISFEIPSKSKITLRVYDTMGKSVRTLLSNEVRQAGLYSIPFDASGLPSGVYLFRLKADNSRAQTCKALLIK